GTRASTSLQPFPTRRSSDLLAALHRDDVAVRDAQLEDLFARDDALPRRHGSRERVEHRRLAGLRGACDEDVEPRLDRGREEGPGDRKSTRLNSSHVKISYAV